MAARSSLWAPLLCALMLHAGAQAAAPANERAGSVPAADLARLIQRIERLEQENRELRARLDAGASAASTEQRLKALEDAKASTERALASERVSESEPELITRLKAVEFQTLNSQKQARQIEALEGVSVGASLAALVQGVNAAGSADGRPATRANYRGDVSVGLPGGSLGDIEGKLFALVRFGQGEGLALRPTYTSAANTGAFQTAAGADDSFAILAQAWYQLRIPLPRGGYAPHSKQHLDITVGKMDPFLFFDQNAIADDETIRFLNNAFVHNPLLDSGGDIGGDAYGFTPGARVAYVSAPAKANNWSASLGVFASRDGTNFSGSLGKPLVLAQFDIAPRIFGLVGNYRLYGWRNGRVSDFDGTVAPHSGWGMSIDQRVDGDWTLFARYGQQITGRPRFDRALTLGAEVSGSDWGRGADGVGLALGLLRSADDYRAAAAVGSGETIAELYYRYQLNNRVHLTPDLQWIRRPAAELQASTARTVGLRAKVAF